MAIVSVRAMASGAALAVGVGLVCWALGGRPTGGAGAAQPGNPELVSEAGTSSLEGSGERAAAEGAAGSDPAGVEPGAEREPVDSKPRLSVRIRVQNERGIGLPERRVRLETPDEEHGGWLLLSWALTGPSGEAELALGEDPDAFFNENPSLRLARSRWFADDEARDVLPEDFRAGTEFVFEEGATGDLELVLVEPDGGRLAGVVGLTVLPVPGSEFESRRISSIQREASWVVLGVPLGLEFDVDTRRSTDTRRMEGVEQRFGTFQGPSRSGERLRYELVLEPAELLFAGRALDADGAAMGTARITMTLVEHADIGKLRRVEVTTDEHGRFRFAVPDFLALDRRVERVLMRAGKWGELMAQYAAAERHDPPVLAGAIEMGDLRFGPGAVIVAGQVLDVEGRPGGGVKVKLQGRGVRSLGEESRWSDFDLRSDLFCEADVTFEWRGAWAPESLRVLAHRYTGGRWERAWIDGVGRGSTGLVLQLRVP